MKLATIGSGNIGKSIGTWAEEVGYEVIFSAKNQEHAREVARLAGNNARGGSVTAAVREADMILLAVPYSAVKEVLREAGDLMKGKVLIDATNALNSDNNGLLLGFNTSAAEEIQKVVREAKVVKAFNTVFAPVYGSRNPLIKGQKVSVFYAGDDADAKTKVAGLINRLGFDAVDAGPLSSARNLEALAMLNITLGYTLGYGTGIGFSLLR